MVVFDIAGEDNDDRRQYQVDLIDVDLVDVKKLGQRKKGKKMRKKRRVWKNTHDTWVPTYM